MADNLGGEEAAFDAHVETFEIDRAIGLGIDARALMEIVYNLPGLGQEDEDEQAANICTYADTMNALRTYVAAYRRASAARARGEQLRPTVGTMRDSLKRLQGALTEVAAAWAATDLRTQNAVYLSIGEQPFDADSEMLPHSEVRAPSDAWERGGYRILKWEEGTARLAKSVAAVKREADDAEQDRRQPGLVGFDELTERLGEIFTQRIGLALSTSRNHGSAKDFIAKAISTLPAQYRPSDGKIEWAIRRAMLARG
jgi:hypothetical protein